MAKKVENVSHLNYVVLIQSMLQKNGYKAWNTYVEKHFRKSKSHPETGFPTINLKFLNFENFDLRGADLSYVDFTGSYMMSCNISGSEAVLNPLKGTIFDRCDLRDADLSRTLLVDASFFDATLINNDLTGATNLKNAVLKGSNWEQAYVASDQLAQAHIRGVRNLSPEVARDIADDIYHSLVKPAKPEEKGNPNITTSGEIESSNTPLPEAAPIVGNPTVPNSV